MSKLDDFWRVITCIGVSGILALTLTLLYHSEPQPAVGGLVRPYDDSLADRLASGGDAIEVNPHDTNNLDQVCRGVYVGTAGDLKVVTARGDTVTFKNMVAGCIHPIAVKQIFDTGTTAALIVAVY